MPEREVLWSPVSATRVSVRTIGGGALAARSRRLSCHDGRMLQHDSKFDHVGSIWLQTPLMGFQCVFFEAL